MAMKVTVWRGDATGGHDQTFEVPRHDSQTVLDVVSWIQAEADPTLSYRFACRVGMCGSCAMMVNGVPRWTCRTHVEKVLQPETGTDGCMSIAPLRNLPVIKDLAADMDPFFDKWTAADAKAHAGASRHEPIREVRPNEPGRVAASAGIECINCAVCYAACDTVAANPDYMGPAALQRLWTLYNDPKERHPLAVLDQASGTGGCHSCHSMGSCAEYCPNELNPLAAIAGLKRESVRHAFNRKGRDKEREEAGR